MANENESEEQEQEQEFKVSDRRYSVRGYEDEDESSGVEEKVETPPQASPVVSDPSQTAEAPGPGVSGSSAPAGSAGEAGPTEEASPPEAPPGEDEPTQEGEVTREFETLIAILQTNAIAAMGINPQTGERSGGADPRSAKLFVDMISMVKDKMAGNLSEGEEQILSQVLSELRMMYVQHVGVG
jgi:hypothetical protein